MNDVKDVNDIKKMTVKEFRKLGYLQELNRKFLHPLGLALEVSIGDDNVESLSGIWDFRDDDEGIQYGLINSDNNRIKKFNDKANYIESEMKRILPTRINALGFEIEPIPAIKK